MLEEKTVIVELGKFKPRNPKWIVPQVLETGSIDLLLQGTEL